MIRLRRWSDPTCQNATNRPSRVGGAKGWNIMFNWVIFPFLLSCQALENTVWEYRRILCTGWRVSVGIDFLGGLNIYLSYFPHKSLKNRKF